MNDREAYDMHAWNGILFNHESPLGGETFATRKITRAATAIPLARQDMLYLGNLDARYGWGHAREYVRGMWIMLQTDEPDDYVLATGVTILGLTRLVMDVLGYDGPIVHDRTKPDGTPRKLMDVSKLAALGWRATTPLREGIRQSYEAYKSGAHREMVLG